MNLNTGDVCPRRISFRNDGAFKSVFGGFGNALLPTSYRPYLSRQSDLAKLLKQGANVLLLDEPTNDLDVETLRALEDAVQAFPGSAMVISHDRWFLDRIATHILAYEDDGTVVFHEGNYSEYEEDRRARLGRDADVPSRIKHRKLM